jgi:hypothetical protein
VILKWIDKLDEISSALIRYPDVGQIDLIIEDKFALQKIIKEENMSDVCKLSEVKATVPAKKAGIACVEKSLNGAVLVESLKAMNVNMDMAVEKKWINNRHSGHGCLMLAK